MDTIVPEKVYEFSLSKRFMPTFTGLLLSYVSARSLYLMWGMLFHSKVPLSVGFAVILILAGFTVLIPTMLLGLGIVLWAWKGKLVFYQDHLVYYGVFAKRIVRFDEIKRTRARVNGQFSFHVILDLERPRKNGVRISTFGPRDEFVSKSLTRNRHGCITLLPLA